MRLKDEALAFIWPRAIKFDTGTQQPLAHADWSLSQERQFMEDLVYKRLTLFLAIAAALVAGVINLTDRPGVAAILMACGTILCWVLQQTVHRAQLKLDIILQLLFADDTHPAGRINNILNDNSRVRLVGVVVPSVICLLLTALTIAEVLIAIGWLDMPA